MPNPEASFQSIESFHHFLSWKNKGLTKLRLLFVLATEHTLLRLFLDIWRQILFLGDLHDTAL